MLRLVGRRTVGALVTLLLVVTIAFFAVNLLLPYDFAVGPGQRAGAMEEIRRQLRLDRPLWIRWLDYMAHLIRGDLGSSFGGERVSTIVFAGLPSTTAIFAVGGLVAYLLGEWIGRVVAWHRGRLLSAAATTGGVVLFTAFPPWLLFLLMYFFTDRVFQARSLFGMGLAPYGAIPPELRIGVVTAVLLMAVAGGVLLRGWARRRDRRLVGLVAMPACLLGGIGVFLALGVWADAIDLLLRPSVVMASTGLILIAFGETMLVMRVGVMAEMGEDYVFTARAKGVSERAIRDRHVAPNAVLPALSRFVTGVPYLLAGLIIIEREVKLRGMASVFFSSIESGDIPVIIGTLVVVGLIGLVLRIVLDLIQVAVDPRLRLEGARE